MNVVKKLVAALESLIVGITYYLRCNTYASYTKLNRCTPHSMRMDYVEKIVLDVVKQLLKNFNNTEKMKHIAIKHIREKLKENNNISTLNQLKENLNKLIIEIDTIYSDKLNGIISQDDFSRIYCKKSEDRKKLEEEISKFECNLNYNNILNENEIAEKLVKKFLFDFNINKKIIVRLINKIEVDKNKKIYIYFNFKM